MTQRRTSRYLLLLFATTLCLACGKKNPSIGKPSRKKTVPTVSADTKGIQRRIENIGDLPQAIQAVDKIRKNATAKRAAADKAAEDVNTALETLKTAQKKCKAALEAYHKGVDEELENLGGIYQKCTQEIEKLKKKIRPYSYENNRHRENALTSIEQELKKVSPKNTKLTVQKTTLNTALTGLDTAEKDLAAKQTALDTALTEAQKAEKEAEAAEKALKEKAEK